MTGSSRGAPGTASGVRLPEGKVAWERIADRVKASLPPGVLLGPGLGEDAALLRLGGETWAVAADPVTFTAEDAGRLAVLVNANDLAVRGATPAYLLAVVLVAPREAQPERVDALLAQVQNTCAELGIALVGGHTEVTPGLAHTIVVGTLLGKVEDRAITTAGLRPGDWVGMTKWAGLEGTAILLTELGDRLRARHGDAAFRSLDRVFPGERLSVVPEARIAARNPHVTALHDVTEGGVGEALHELAAASGLRLEVAREEVPVLPETRRLCEDLGLDPLGLIGSGALLVGCAAEGREDLGRALDRAGVPLRWLGTAHRADGAPSSGLPRFPRDELVKTRLLDGIEAVVFDMDGTLIDSGYDWPAIRRRLGVTGPSILAHLDGLEGEEREALAEALHAIEREASERARPAPGATDLLAFLRGKGLRTALVTNNSGANTGLLLERFGLAFDVVLTRDSGLWKPSGAPLLEALERLGVRPDRALAVGDSHYDVLATREAGCARLCLLHARDEELRRQADHSFPDIAAFLRFLDLVL